MKAKGYDEELIISCQEAKPAKQVELMKHRLVSSKR